MKYALILLVCALPALPAVDGTVVNKTNGKPEPRVVLQLMQPSQQGLQTVGTALSDASGHFHFDQEPPGPKLVQAIYAGVLYTHMIPPGTPTSGVEVPVYDVTKDRSAAKVSEHMILLQPGAGEVSVSETFLYQNDGTKTFNDPPGTARFLAMGDVKQAPTVSITPPGGMPITRPTEADQRKNTFHVDYPVMPGETRFDVSYTIPSSDPLLVSGRNLETSTPLRLVVPAGVTLKGDNLDMIGQEPTTQAVIYNVKGNDFKVQVQGTGALSPDNGSAADSGAPQIQEATPRLYDRVGWILGITFSILLLGSILLWRRAKGEN
ncbi:MAG TPA: hypothetical protein VMJ34_20940 [Bryobacteraceae bacterium]|nr:hypothetical protein [Bryobacteraceae bacterium]